MKNIQYYLIVVIVSIVMASASKGRPVHIFMAGDSTMANKLLYKNVWDSIAQDSIREPFLEMGWGQVLPQYFDSSIVIDNYAKNGRSTRTFISEGLWDKLINNVQPSDYVIIQFGHNDESKEKVDRYTSPEDYKANLVRFITEVKAKGGQSIVCTPVVRRKFDKKGVFEDSHGVYLDMARSAAIETNTPLIDMYEKSKRLIIGLGDKGSIPLFMHVGVNENRLYPIGKMDDTHFREAGAKAMVKLFIEGIREKKIEGLISKLKQE